MSAPSQPPLDIAGITELVIAEIARRILPVPELDLTPVEVRMIKLMGRGWTMKRIAAAFNLKHPSDIHNRVRECCVKNNDINRHQLAAYGALIAMHHKEL